MIVQLTTKAKAELDSAIAFVRRDSTRAAATLRSRVEDAIGSLAQLPNRGRSGRVAGTRELLVRGTPYILVYSTSADRVLVLSVRHTSQGQPV